MEHQLSGSHPQQDLWKCVGTFQVATVIGHLQGREEFYMKHCSPQCQKRPPLKNSEALLVSIAGAMKKEGWGMRAGRPAHGTDRGCCEAHG